MAAQIKTIGVVGTGLIGSSWAALFLAHGLRVLVSDPAPGAADKLTKYLETVWPTLEQLTSQMSFDQALANLEFVGQSLGERATDVDFIQEVSASIVSVPFPLITLSTADVSCYVCVP